MGNLKVRLHLPTYHINGRFSIKRLVYAMGTNLEAKNGSCPERDGTSTADVPEYCWVFSPPGGIASVMRLYPPTVLFRDDYLQVFTELFTSSGLGIFIPNLDCNLGATFPSFLSGVRVPQDTNVNGFILTGYSGVGA